MSDVRPLFQPLPLGPPTSLRSIVLLTTLRNTLSLITLKWITAKVNQYWHRLTADSVLDILLLMSYGPTTGMLLCDRNTNEINILGIDMSKAFNTICRDKLIEVVSSFLEEDEVQLIRLFLADTYLWVRLGCELSESFQYTNRTLQGDSLFPVLFIIYLEAALHLVRDKSPTRPATDTHLPSEITYAGDIDFVSTCKQWLRQVEFVAE